MKRFITPALAFAIVGFVGCTDETKVESKDTISTPTGTTEIKKTTEVDQSGSNPPAATPAP